MQGVFSRQTVRSAPLLTKCLVASIVLSAAVLLYTQGKTGEMLDRMSYHFHHARATWSFFVIGVDVYTQPLGLTAERVPYPQTWGTWQDHPAAYPPGTFVVFALPALLGRYVTLSALEFGKIVIAYLSLVMHAAMWASAIVARRVGSGPWMAVIGFLWLFSIRMSLLGFYDGAWLLTAALAIHAMLEKRFARAVLWFVASALISYRAACLTPIAALAYWQLIRSGAPVRIRLGVTVVAATGVAVVLACFRAFVKYGPTSDAVAHGRVMSSYLWLVLTLCLALAVAVAVGSSALVGVCVALSSVLGVYHRGFCWDGYVLVAPILALSLAERRPAWVQISIGLWFVYALQTFFAYPPFFFLDELVRFFANHGFPPRY